MSDKRGDVIAFLIRRGVASSAQLAEAWEMSRRTRQTLGACLIRLGHASPEKILRALAEFYGLPFISLDGLTVPREVLALLPASVAWENAVLPLGASGEVLVVAVSDPTDLDTVQKLQFILNRDVVPVVATREQIVAAVRRHYGELQTDSVDSMLAEFTDTAIDFTEAESAGLDYRYPVPPERDVSIDLESSVEYEEDEDRQAPVPRPRTPVERRATVRYYHRMNPERLFPLLVVLSEKEIRAVAKAGVAQGSSERFRVEEGSVVEVEPILPGCDCFPPREQVKVRPGTVEVTFWVAPHVLGQLRGARVVVRQGGDVLAEVPLEGRVVKQGLTAVLGVMSLLLPFALAVLKHFHLDFESQLEDGFGLYAAVAGWAMRSLSPELLAGLLLAATVAAYFWLRPRKRDVFWDVKTVEPDEPPTPAATPQAPEPVPPSSSFDRQRALFFCADEHFANQDYRPALRLYEKGLRHGEAAPRVHHRAALAAHFLGQTPRALEMLRAAVGRVPPGRGKAVMLYNMGCFAAKLGRSAEAMRHLHQAVAAGYDDANKYRSDPDLAALRHRDEFKRLLESLGCAAPRAEKFAQRR